MDGSRKFSIPLFDLDYSEEELNAVAGVVKSKWISSGPKVMEFERRFSEFVGVKHAVAVSSGSAALHLAYLAAGIGEGDEVIVPSNTFIATVSMIIHTGAKPVFADIQSVTHPNISVSTIERHVNGRTKAVVFLHYAGFTDNIVEIREFCDKKGLILIEDAAHAHGSLTSTGVKAGAVGHIAAFSFYANKVIAVGEGGMVTTSDDGLAEKVRLLRSHGMTSLSWDRRSSVGRPADYDVVLMGFNYRMSELHAALGIAQLSKVMANNERRRELFELYRDVLKRKLDGVVSVPYGESDGVSHYIMPVLLDTDHDRDRVGVEMGKLGVQTSVHYRPVHKFRYFLDHFPDVNLPETEEFGLRELTLPLYPSMRDEDVEFVVDALARAIEIVEK